MTTKTTATKSTGRKTSAKRATPGRPAATKPSKPAAQKPRATGGTADEVSALEATVKPVEPTKKPRGKKAGSSGPKRLSALDAAAKVLAESDEPMNCKQLIEAMAEKKLWTSPGGKTPHATLYSAILRELNTKGGEARFKKIERGKFVANG